MGYLARRAPLASSMSWMAADYRNDRLLCQTGALFCPLSVARKSRAHPSTGSPRLRSGQAGQVEHSAKRVTRWEQHTMRSGPSPMSRAPSRLLKKPGNGPKRHTGRDEVQIWYALICYIFWIQEHHFWPSGMIYLLPVWKY